MTTLQGIDYSGTHPSIAQLKAAGKSFVVRYLPYNGMIPATKGITPAELAALTSAGIKVAFTFEIFLNDPLGGAAKGTYNAVNFIKPAIAQLRLPADVPIYICVDFDAQPYQQPAIDAYLNAIGAVIGKSRVGVYGSYQLLARCEANRSASWFWQTYAWSGGNVFRANHIYQYNIYSNVAGIPADFDQTSAYDFGQMPRPAVLPNTATGFGLPGWPSYAQTLIGAQDYAYRILVNRGVARFNCLPGQWGMTGWPLYARIAYRIGTNVGAAPYALRIFKANPNYRP